MRNDTSHVPYVPAAIRIPLEADAKAEELAREMQDLPLYAGVRVNKSVVMRLALLAGLKVLEEQVEKLVEGNGKKKKGGSVSVKRVVGPNGEVKYVSDLRDERGVRERKGFDRKGEADTYDANRKQQIRASKLGGVHIAEPNITLEEYVKAWLPKRAARNIDVATTFRQQSDLSGHLLPVFGKRRMRDLHRALVKNFLEEKLVAVRTLKDGTEKKYARGSVHNMFTTLSAIFTHAVSAHVIVAHPIRGLWKELNEGQKEEEEEDVKAFDPAQAAAFLTGTLEHEPTFYPYFATLMLAGLRPSEGIAVMGTKLDFVTKKALVDIQLYQHGGKKRTKTGKPRKVDLSARLAGILRGAIVERKKGKLAGEDVGPWLFFPSMSATPDRNEISKTYQQVLRAMGRVLAKVGLPEYFTPHALRHTFATTLIAAGVPPVYVQQQMGHKTIKETIETYGSWFPAQAPGAVDVMAETLFSGRAGSGAVASGDQLGHEMDTAVDGTDGKSE